MADIPSSASPNTRTMRVSPEAHAALQRILESDPADEEFSGEDYRVRLPIFEGPLDLLLHLIRRDQINIYDIPIAQICKSYLATLESMSRHDVNVAGEFFVMAATLTFLKSQTLLPKEEGDEEVEDPRLPLVAQLLEYEQFKQVAKNLDARPWLGRDVWARPLTASDDLMPEEVLLDSPIDPVETFQLLVCLKAAIDRTERPPLRISVDNTSLREKVEVVSGMLEAQEVLDFSRILPAVPRHKQEIIVSFLAVLELARLKFVEIIQTETFGPIQIRCVRNLKDLNMALLDHF